LIKRFKRGARVRCIDSSLAKNAECQNALLARIWY
jgi:hypothetical protein